jgi:V8-like Glu-specific endopeptidase
VIEQYGLTRKNRIVSVETKKRKISYSISTLPGQSGSPIVTNEKIVALHSGGGMDEYNVGRLITHDLVKDIRNWSEELKGSQFAMDGDICCHK